MEVLQDKDQVAKVFDFIANRKVEEVGLVEAAVINSAKVTEVASTPSCTDYYVILLDEVFAAKMVVSKDSSVEKIKVAVVTNTVLVDTNELVSVATDCKGSMNETKEDY